MGWITQKEEENEEFQVQRNRKHLGRGRIQVWNPKTTQPEKGVKEMMTTGNQFEALHDPDLRDAEETGTKEKTPTNKWVGKPKGDEEQRNTIEHEKEIMPPRIAVRGCPARRNVEPQEQGVPNAPEVQPQ
uniref:Uncharacterized protein n=1 Tax=Solanum tuberosum TaxID=4113 RepID=M1DMQ8_SOLTU